MCLLTLGMTTIQAQAFRGGTQSLCNGKELVIFKTNHVCEIWDDGVLVYTGKWERPSGNIIVICIEGGETIRVTIKTDAFNITSMIFRNHTYYPCNK